MEDREGMRQTGLTRPVPGSYARRSARPGTVETLIYWTGDGTGESISKTAYVYLPWGYAKTPEARYDILYLMHGWEGHARDYFDVGSGFIKTLLDWMIEAGDIPPLIVVSASFYAEGDSRDFDESCERVRRFHREFDEALMPAAEGRYRTYAASTASEALAASRDHRAFGGFSLGSVATWLEFCYDADFIRCFLPMSGSCWYYGTYGDFQYQRNVDHLEALARKYEAEGKDFFIYHTTGTEDSVKSQSVMQAEEMLKRAGVFTPTRYRFCQKDGGYHDYDAVREYLYNALPLFFGAWADNDSSAHRTT